MNDIILTVRWSNGSEETHPRIHVPEGFRPHGLDPFNPEHHYAHRVNSPPIPLSQVGIYLRWSGLV